LPPEDANVEELAEIAARQVAEQLIPQVKEQLVRLGDSLGKALILLFMELNSAGVSSDKKLLFGLNAALENIATTHGKTSIGYEVIARLRRDLSQLLQEE
jgi:hypothetical protein